MNRRNFLYWSGVISAGLSSLGNHVTFVKKASQPRNVLVLGGTGFFGPVLVKELLARGHRVTLFNRGISNPHLFPELPRIKGDRELEDKKGLSELVKSNQQWDWVVDTWQNSPLAVVDSLQVLKGKFSHYQYVSTVSVYDDWDEVGINENSALNPVPPMPDNFGVEHRYAIRKTMAEIAIQDHIENNFSVYRSHGMRGERKRVEESKSEPYWPIKVLRGGDMILPAEAEYYQVTDMISLAQFMVHCGENEIFGPFNVAYQPFKFKAFLEGIKKLTDSDVKFHWLPNQFFLDNDAEIYRTNRAGRYRFNIDRAHKNGLKNRSLDQLNLDQIKGFQRRHPDGNFEFGHPGTHSLSKARELELLELWQRLNKK